MGLRVKRLSPLLLWQSLFGWESIPLLLCQPLAHLFFWYNCQQGADSFYLSIAKALCGTDYKIVSVCLSVIAPIRSQCWIEFYELCTAVLVEKTNIEFVRGSESDNAFPYFTPNFHQFSLFLMHFQWDGANTAASRRVDRLWRLIPHTTPLGNR